MVPLTGEGPVALIQMLNDRTAHLRAGAVRSPRVLVLACPGGPYRRCSAAANATEP